MGNADRLEQDAFLVAFASQYCPGVVGRALATGLPPACARILRTNCVEAASGEVRAVRAATSSPARLDQRLSRVTVQAYSSTPLASSGGGMRGLCAPEASAARGIPQPPRSSDPAGHEAAPPAEARAPRRRPRPFRSARLRRHAHRRSEQRGLEHHIGRRTMPRRCSPAMGATSLSRARPRWVSPPAR